MPEPEYFSERLTPASFVPAPAPPGGRPSTRVPPTTFPPPGLPAPGLATSGIPPLTFPPKSFPFKLCTPPMPRPMSMPVPLPCHFPSFPGGRLPFGPPPPPPGPPPPPFPPLPATFCHCACVPAATACGHHNNTGCSNNSGNRCGNGCNNRGLYPPCGATQPSCGAVRNTGTCGQAIGPTPIPTPAPFSGFCMPGTKLALGPFGKYLPIYPGATCGSTPGTTTGTTCGARPATECVPPRYTYQPCQGTQRPGNQTGCPPEPARTHSCPSYQQYRPARYQYPSQHQFRCPEHESGTGIPAQEGISAPVPASAPVHNARPTPSRPSNFQASGTGRAPSRAPTPHPHPHPHPAPGPNVVRNHNSRPAHSHTSGSNEYVRPSVSSRTSSSTSSVFVRSEAGDVHIMNVTPPPAGDVRIVNVTPPPRPPSRPSSEPRPERPEYFSERPTPNSQNQPQPILGLSPRSSSSSDSDLGLGPLPAPAPVSPHLPGGGGGVAFAPGAMPGSPSPPPSSLGQLKRPGPHPLQSLSQLGEAVSGPMAEHALTADPASVPLPVDDPFPTTDPAFEERARGTPPPVPPKVPMSPPPPGSLGHFRSSSGASYHPPPPPEVAPSHPSSHSHQTPSPAPSYLILSKLFAPSPRRPVPLSPLTPRFDAEEHRQEEYREQQHQHKDGVVESVTEHTERVTVVQRPASRPQDGEGASTERPESKQQPARNELKYPPGWSPLSSSHSSPPLPGFPSRRSSASAPAPAPTPGPEFPSGRTPEPELAYPPEMHPDLEHQQQNRYTPPISPRTLAHYRQRLARLKSEPPSEAGDYFSQQDGYFSDRRSKSATPSLYRPAAGFDYRPPEWSGPGERVHNLGPLSPSLPRPASAASGFSNPESEHSRRNGHNMAAHADFGACPGTVYADRGSLSAQQMEVAPPGLCRVPNVTDPDSLEANQQMHMEQETAIEGHRHAHERQVMQHAMRQDEYVPPQESESRPISRNSSTGNTSSTISMAGTRSHVRSQSNPAFPPLPPSVSEHSIRQGTPSRTATPMTTSTAHTPSPPARTSSSHSSRSRAHNDFPLPTGFAAHPRPGSSGSHSSGGRGRSPPPRRSPPTPLRIPTPGSDVSNFVPIPLYPSSIPIHVHESVPVAGPAVLSPPSDRRSTPSSVRGDNPLPGPLPGGEQEAWDQARVREFDARVETHLEPQHREMERARSVLGHMSTGVPSATGSEYRPGSEHGATPGAAESRPLSRNSATSLGNASGSVPPPPNFSSAAVPDTSNYDRLPPLPPSLSPPGFSLPSSFSNLGATIGLPEPVPYPYPPLPPSVFSSSGLSLPPLPPSSLRSRRSNGSERSGVSSNVRFDQRAEVFEYDGEERMGDTVVRRME